MSKKDLLSQCREALGDATLTNLDLLNSDKELDLLNKRFIVFELDVVKDNPILFPVVTIIIMETFINKMRRLQGIRKMILIEEA